MSKVFISGSIAIKKLPNDVIHSLQRIIDNNLEVLVGDANGIDKLIQNYFKTNNYYNVCVYSVYERPRNLCSSKFKIKSVDACSSIKKERERQIFKDSQMTSDSDYSFIIWDGKSKGSYKNILRAIEQKKKSKVYLSKIEQFLEQKKINKNEIDFIFRKNNGYSAKEIIEYFNNEGKEYFNNTRQLNKYLLDNKVIEKQDKAYIPLTHEELFIIEKYRGKVSGIKFNDKFIDWIDDKMRRFDFNQGNKQASLFG